MYEHYINAVLLCLHKCNKQKLNYKNAPDSKLVFLQYSNNFLLGTDL